MDLWNVDRTNQILYCIEVKNKSEITPGDLSKFRLDLENIKNNLETYNLQNYFVTGLFISLSCEEISQDVRDFSFTPEATYISKSNLNVKFMELYFKSIEFISKIPKSIPNYEEVLGIIQKEYSDLNLLTKSLKNIKLHANEIIKEEAEVELNILNKLNTFKELLINLNSKETERLLIEQKIKKYINSNRNFTIIKVREMSSGFNIFNSVKLTKAYLIDWAKV